MTGTITRRRSCVESLLSRRVFTCPCCKRSYALIALANHGVQTVDNNLLPAVYRVRAEVRLKVVVLLLLLFLLSFYSNQVSETV